MRFISLFSGIGGFDLGFERAGMTCVAQVEIDKSCASVLNRHWKGVNKFEDVKKCGHYNLPPTDLICGGFPCQDLSIAGKRAGLDGERSGLWFEFHRIIAELKPEWVVIENVPGLLSSNDGKDFAVILRGLVELGYGVSWRVLDSQYFGVPQRRRRVFIVGSLGSGRSAEILFEREGIQRDTSESEEQGEETASTFTIRTGKDGGGKGYLGNVDNAMTLGGQSQRLDTVGSLQARDYKGVGNQYVNENKLVTTGALQSRDYKGTGTTIDDKLVAVGHSGGETLKLNRKANTLNAQTGSETTAMFNGVWEPRSQDGVPRFHNDLVPSLNTMQGGQRQPMVGVRRLTPVECERLQGFPDGWTDHQADSIRYRQLGNAVTVSVIEWLGKRIADNENRK